VSDGFVADDGFEEDAPAKPNAPGVIEQGVNMIGRGAWALPGLAGLDHETVQAAIAALEDPQKRGGDVVSRFKAYKQGELERSRQVDKESPIVSGLVRGAASAPGEALTWALAPEVKLAQGAKLLEKAASFGPRLGLLSGASEYGSTASRDPAARAGGAAGVAAAGTVLGGLGAGMLPNPAALAPARTAAERLRETAINQGRKLLTGNANPLATKKPLSDEAIQAAYDVKAIRPFSPVEKAANRLDEVTAKLGEEYGQTVKRLAAAGVEGPDARDLAAALRAASEETRLNSAGSGAPEMLGGLADEIGGATIPQHHGPPIVIPSKAPGKGRPPSFAPVATNLDWPAPPNLELPFPQRQTAPGPSATWDLPAPEPVAITLEGRGAKAVPLGAPAQESLLRPFPPLERPSMVYAPNHPRANEQGFVPKSLLGPLSPDALPGGKTVPGERLLPGTTRPAPDSGWGLAVNERSAIPTSQGLAYQESALPAPLRVPDRPKPVPVSTEIRFDPGTPDDWALRLEQTENIKRSLQDKAKYDRVQGDDVMMGARKGAASIVRAANERAIEDQSAKAPDLAAAFVPLKRKLGPLIEASDAADIAAARAANRQPHGLGSKVMAAGALSTGNVPAAAATLYGTTALRNRGPATLGWAANKAAKLLRSTTLARGGRPASPTAGAQAEVEALLEFLRAQGAGLRPATVGAEDDR
jgi:hypothetical protein